MVKDPEFFLHNLSVSLASFAEEQLRLAEITPSDDVINHLSQAIGDALKFMVEARNSQ